MGCIHHPAALLFWRKRPLSRTAVILFFTAASAVIGIVASSRQSEPSENGRCLSDWLLLYGRDRLSHRDLAKDADAAAVRRIGSNAIPCLLKWMQYTPPEWKKWLQHQIMPRLPAMANHFFADTREAKAEASVEGFRILGPLGIAAVPRLSTLMNNPQSAKLRQRAMEALTGVGKEGVLTLANSIQDQTTIDWESVVNQLTVANEENADFTLALPVLLRSRKSSNEVVAERAERIILRFANFNAGGFSVQLADMLRDSDLEVQISALEVLAQMGHGASQVFDRVAPMTSDSDILVRQAATNTLKAISD